MATLCPSPQEGLDPSLGGVEACGKEREVLPHAGDLKFFLREFNCMSKIQRMMKHLKVFVSSAGLPSVYVISFGGIRKENGQNNGSLFGSHLTGDSCKSDQVVKGLLCRV